MEDEVKVCAQREDMERRRHRMHLRLQSCPLTFSKIISHQRETFSLFDQNEVVTSSAPGLNPNQVIDIRVDSGKGGLPSFTAITIHCAALK